MVVDTTVQFESYLYCTTEACFLSVITQIFTSHSITLDHSQFYTVSLSTRAAVVLNKNEKFRSFKSKKIFIRKAEDRPYLGFGYKSLISDPIRSGKRSQKKILELAKVARQSSQRLIYVEKTPKYFKICFENES